MVDASAPASGGGQHRVEPERLGQIAQAQVEADAGPQQAANLRVGLRLAECRLKPQKHDLRYAQSQDACDLAGDELGDERLSALARAQELHHVQFTVIGLHDRGQRTAFAQRRQVVGSDQVSELRHIRKQANGR